MLRDKMMRIMEYVNSQEAEREELVHAVALALLTRKNLFVLGDTGQSKSHAVSLFCRQIRDAKMFLTVMSKQTDQEQLFGRLDLSSVIPGNVSQRVLDRDPGYAQLKEQLEGQLACCRQNPNDLSSLKAAAQTQQKMEILRKCLSEVCGGRPEYITTGKIPEAHICFLDELFKANEGLLDSLLMALNERQYVNEGAIMSIPVVSFFSASNEIPNFNNPEERILKALYDRFDLKVHTHYVQNKTKRMEVLHKKQDASPQKPFDGAITMQELVFMQDEVRQVTISKSINELWDNILCELRKKEIHVSDRTYFNYSGLVKAEAWLQGRDQVLPEDMGVLVNYLWNRPEEIPVVGKVIQDVIEDPMGDQIRDIQGRAYGYFDEFSKDSNKNKALVQLRKNLLICFDRAVALKDGLSDESSSLTAIDSLIDTLESLSREAYSQSNFTYIPFEELKALQTA